MRLFIAIDFDAGDEFFQWIQKQIDKRLIKVSFTKSYHLTLKFLGEVDEKKVEEIKSRLAGIEFEQFKICFDRIGFFSNEGNVRVIWAGVEENHDILNLQRKIDDCLISFFPRDKKFHPHVTLARVKFVRDKETFKRNISGMSINKKCFDVKEFKLIKSVLIEDGAMYSEMGVFKGMCIALQKRS